MAAIAGINGRGASILGLCKLTAFSAGSNDGDPIVLVDVHDVPQGVAPKIEVHRRHPAKYHSGGLWTNACCSHPRPGESAGAAAQRRLAEEMGIRCEVRPLFTAHYRAAVSNGYIEDEVVHAFGATYEGPIAPDPAEVSEWKWMPLSELAGDLTRRPELYTIWLRHYFREHDEVIAAWMKSG